MVALLQPAPETFELFDDVMLLSEGHMVYFGPRVGVVPYFESMGFRLPPRKGIADFLQEVTSKKDQQARQSLLGEKMCVVGSICRTSLMPQGTRSNTGWLTPASMHLCQSRASRRPSGDSKPGQANAEQLRQPFFASPPDAPDPLIRSRCDCTPDYKSSSCVLGHFRS